MTLKGENYMEYDEKDENSKTRTTILMDVAMVLSAIALFVVMIAALRFAPEKTEKPILYQETGEFVVERLETVSVKDKSSYKPINETIYLIVLGKNGKTFVAETNSSEYLLYDEGDVVKGTVTIKDKYDLNTTQMTNSTFVVDGTNAQYKITAYTNLGIA